MADHKGVAPIIIKKHKGDHGAPHGSTTWKIALADFMTAMFIIFLLLWLINQTTPETRKGIAQYFAPRTVSDNPSGAGGLLGGQSPTQPGAQTSQSAPLGPPTGGGPSTPETGEGNTEVPGYPGAVPQPIARAVEPGVRTGVRPEDLEKAQIIDRRIKQAIQEIPELRAFEQNIQIEPTKEGVRIQLVDTNKQELFASGNAKPTPQVQALMKAVAHVIGGVPNPVAITGHTDSTAIRRKDYSNWDLSADRANSARRMLQENGIDEARVSSVTGVADREPIDSADPAAPRNRRISIVLLTDTPIGGQAAVGFSRPTVEPPGPAPLGRLIPR